jgi:hypothetical protein
LRLGDGDRESRTGEREAERGVIERRGDLECAERGAERVREGSREMLRERDRDADRAGDGLRDGIFRVNSSFGGSSDVFGSSLRLL